MKCVPGRMSLENQTQCFPPMSSAAAYHHHPWFEKKRLSVERKRFQFKQLEYHRTGKGETQTSNRPVLEAGEAEGLILKQCPVKNGVWSNQGKTPGWFSTRTRSQYWGGCHARNRVCGQVLDQRLLGIDSESRQEVTMGKLWFPIAPGRQSPAPAAVLLVEAPWFPGF